MFFRFCVIIGSFIIVVINVNLKSKPNQLKNRNVSGRSHVGEFKYFFVKFQKIIVSVVTTDVHVGIIRIIIFEV